MNSISPYLSITNKANNVAELDIFGDIGYNYWDDTFDEYKANTAQTKKAELQAIKELKATKLKVKINSLGGDLAHALAIYSEIKNLGIPVETYYIGANASAATIIGSVATSVDNIYMDASGLFLVHKPMNFAGGNSNDFEQNIKDLNKWQSAAETIYLNLGVKQTTLNDLMERNGGHGEWLTFNEAKKYGFVGNEYTTDTIQNTITDFKMRGIEPPKIFTNKKNTEMAQEFELTDEHKESMWNWITNKQKIENEKAVNAKELEDLRAKVTNLESELAEKNAEIETLKATETEEEEPVSIETTEEVIEVPLEEVVTNAVNKAMKDLIKPLEQEKVTNTKEENTPKWKEILNKQKFIQNLK